YYFKVRQNSEQTLHWKNGSDFIGSPYYSFSNNGEWLIAQTGSGIAKYDIGSQEASIIDGQTVSGWDLTESPLSNNPKLYTTGLAISGNGRYVVEYVYNNAIAEDRLRIFDTAYCGDADPTTDQDLQTGCVSKDYFPFIKDKIDIHDHIYQVQFNADSSQLIVYVQKADKSFQRFSIAANGYSDSKLDYMALGDSFSSGEGDTQLNPVTGKRYYLPGTDVEADSTAHTVKEKCHISSRSYGFNLQSMMNFPSNRFASIACSGARMNDITISDSQYRGQFGQYEDRGGISFSKAQIDSFKQDAIKNFVPGRAAQIQFVSHYKPGSLTITLGGNNVGFADKLSKCAGPFADCPYVLPGDARIGVGEEIRNQFNGLVKTYKELVEASPKTLVFVVDYPVFVNPSSTICQLNVQIDSDSRKFIDEATVYMNQMIKAAAKKAGVGFIDIQDVLSGHELCDSQASHVTGIALGNDLGSIFGINTVSQETYHPNHLGHLAIAQRIIQALSPDSLATYNYCADGKTSCPDDAVVAPIRTEYFLPQIDYVKTTPSLQDFLAADHSQKQLTGNMELAIHQENLLPNSQANIQMASDPISLGAFTVNNHGVLDVTITIPNSVKVGQHEIHILAQNSGENNLDLYEPLFVAGAPGDVDEDGIPDAQDKCLYVQQANVDEDEDGIDDGCDGNIIKEDVPFTDLYRARNGDSHRLDVTVRQGSTPLYEDPKQVYIERDIRGAERLKLYTNSTKDYDPDTDGWAVVAKTKDAMAGNFANIKTEKIDGKTGFDAYVPTIAIRSLNTGCISLTPQSLALVSEGDDWNQRVPRLLTSDTNTCRTQAPGEDVDNNGVADNVQQLYRARNGSQSTNWFDQIIGLIFNQPKDPTVYIERNATAAEAQLGKSDYDADGDGWAVVGKSNILQQGTVKRMEMVGQQPVAAVLSLINTCGAFTPTNLGTVKKDEQRKLKRYTATLTINCNS
ncbi:MAG TPA: SGNH/GDSL hydrolase family protein, partial [Candidatus Saccharimonadales bacterium]|nr:SGNH/GDSL hydrolase family protein [Candidatus Saccharimonadales bacterium]